MVWFHLDQLKQWYGRRVLTGPLTGRWDKLLLYYFRSTKAQIFTKLKKTVGKQALFYLTSTDTKCFKSCSVSFPTSENTETTASLPRDIRLIFTENPKMKHRSGSEVPELSEQQLKFLPSPCIWRMGLSGQVREKSVHKEKGQTQGTRRGKSPQYSLSCAIKAALSKAL